MAKFYLNIVKNVEFGNKKNDRSEYEEWKATHQYINHEKSSGSMVAAGAVEIFQYSVQKNKLVY